jgi:hypothetical protein
MTAPFGRLVGRSSRKEEAAMIIEATGDPIDNRGLGRYGACSVDFVLV